MNQTEQLSELLEQILNYKDKKALKTFFMGILTPKELREIPTRLFIVKLLKQGIPQKEIAKKLGVGIATVTRGSKELQRGRFTDV